MAIEAEFLGKRLQCPHCQEFIQADLSEGTIPQPPPDPSVFLAAAGTEEPESIFASPESTDDALFGAAVIPQIEMPSVADVRPSEDASPSRDEMIEVQLPPPVPDEAPEKLLTPEITGDAPAPFIQDAAPAWLVPASSGLFQVATTDEGPAVGTPVSPPLVTEELVPPSTDGPDAASGIESFPSLPPKPAKRPMRGGLFIALVLIPLVSYSILATIALVLLYLRPQPEHPLENLPDLEGEYKGAKHQKKPVSYERVQHDLELPPKLQINLGQSLRLGDVEVTPLKVELRHLKIHHAGFSPETVAEESLVLHVLLQNVSQDVVFSPTDPFFDRRWKGISFTGRPYTFLEMGQKRFYGGPIPWGQRAQARESIEGQHYGALEPGDRMTTLVCTDPADHVRESLDAYHGSLLWRVQVRRGLVRLADREISATAVVGVKFSDGQVSRHDL
jgi:hypothetical protein